MNYYYREVNPDLRQYVRSILVFDAGGKKSNLPVVTRGIPALFYKEDHSIFLYGESVPDEEWSSEKNKTRIAFLFKPFSLPAAFKCSAKELKESPLDLGRWNARKSKALQDHLHHSKSTADKIKCLERFISGQIERNRRDCEMIRCATDALMQDSSAEVLAQLVAKLNLTERTFQRIFKKYVGVSANEYRRICQHYFAFS
ncbi:hypothetical protein [Fluviicola chungangensis]|uniref:AraC family transcriptional regulator n=1 Tax=Fluviicola chungangensis TaxID=2597671 RepID=A0A556N776_9FLAO|nr:hypothetical protein [Fluviicola chungangensis]TSJ47978.1 hypothetical protein FO442_02265 [Fluviicola chungangensis]